MRWRAADGMRDGYIGCSFRPAREPAELVVYAAADLLEAGFFSLLLAQRRIRIKPIVVCAGLLGDASQFGDSIRQ